MLVPMSVCLRLRLCLCLPRAAWSFVRTMAAAAAAALVSKGLTFAYVPAAIASHDCSGDCDYDCDSDGGGGLCV